MKLTQKLNAIIFTIVLHLLCLNFAYSQEIHVPQIIVSNQGSSRATGYSDSNKIIETDNDIFITTLDFINNRYAVVVHQIDKASDKLISTHVVDSAVKDNHGGGAMVIDSKGIIHIVYGPHSGPFRYKKTETPNDISKWSKVEYIGRSMTYPSLAIDKSTDKLYLLGRYSPQTEKWSLLLYTKSSDEAWSSPLTLFTSRYRPWRDIWFKRKHVHNSYIRTYKSIIVKDSRIHVALKVFEHLPSNKSNEFSTSSNTVSYSVGYFYSDDEGKTWKANEQKVPLPITPTNYEQIVGVDKGPRAIGYYNISNLATDEENIPYLSFSKEDKGTSSIYISKRHNGKWDTSKVVIDNEKYTFFGTSALTITRKSVFLIVNAIPRNIYHPSTLWGSKENALAVLILSKKDLTVDKIKIIDAPSWLPIVINTNNDETELYRRLIYTRGTHSSENNVVIMENL